MVHTGEFIDEKSEWDFDKVKVFEHGVYKLSKRCKSFKKTLETLDDKFLDELFSRFHCFANYAGNLKNLFSMLENGYSGSGYKLVSELFNETVPYAFMDPGQFSFDDLKHLSVEEIEEFFDLELEDVERINCLMFCNRNLFYGEVKNLIKNYQSKISDQISLLEKKVSSELKDSKEVFSLLHKLNDEVYSFADGLGQSNAVKSKKNLYDIVESVLKKCTPENINFKIEIPKELVVETDVGVLERIVENFVFNAIKYSQSADDLSPKQVVLKVCRGYGSLAFIVDDEGIGVPENLRSKLFNDQVIEASPRIRKGIYRSGKGLVSVRGDAKSIGAKPFYEPLSNGSRFGVLLPN